MVFCETSPRNDLPLPRAASHALARQPSLSDSARASFLRKRRPLTRHRSPARARFAPRPPRGSSSPDTAGAAPTRHNDCHKASSSWFRSRARLRLFSIRPMNGLSSSRRLRRWLGDDCVFQTRCHRKGPDPYATYRNPGLHRCITQRGATSVSRCRPRSAYRLCAPAGRAHSTRSGSTVTAGVHLDCCWSSSICRGAPCDR
jgi:hypothetical protein